MTLGRLDVVAYDMERQKVVIVPVNDAQTPGASALYESLNKIYAQAVAHWEVVVDHAYSVEPEVLQTLDEGESGLLSSFPKNMKQFQQDFKKSRDLDKDAYYLFLIPGSGARAGFMPFKRQYGYIWTGATSDVSRTIAHELAHGAFRLRHTFSPEAFIATQGSTNNLMDYSSGATHLYKHQWDNVHNPESVTSWLQDDEEAMEEEMISFYEAAAQLLTEPGAEDFFDRLKQLDKIRTFFTNCSKTGWASYENKGIVPECFWKDVVISSSSHHSVADLPFMAGIVDGAFGEVEGAQQLIELIRDAPDEIGHLSYLIAYHYYKCSPSDIELSVARYSYLIEQIEVSSQHQDIWNQAITWWNDYKGEAEEIEAHWEQCGESEKLITQINDLYEFITDFDTLIDGYLLIEAEINSYLNTLQEGNNESRYLRGKLVVPVATNFVGVGIATKMAKAKEAVKQLKNFTKWDDFTIALGQRLGRIGKKLTFRPTWLPERAIAGNLDNPKGLIGVYRKNLPDGSLVDDTQRALADLDFPETYASNFTTASKDGYKMLNTNEWYYRMDEPAFWDDFNKPWLDQLTSDKADIVVLSDRSNDYLKYVLDADGNPKILNGTAQKTGFGREIEYMDNLVNEGVYRWDEVTGTYKYNGD